MDSTSNFSRNNNNGLKLGVKGKLSNQEMDLLKQKLAEATAYDHIPQEKIQQRQLKAANSNKPMTKIYKKISQKDPTLNSLVRPGRKTLSSIQYEQKFQAYDTQRILPTKGIDPAAKSILQDEYVSKPRTISTIPHSLQCQQEDKNDKIKTGKKLGPTQIPQVFLV